MPAAVAPFGAITVFRIVDGVERLFAGLRAAGAARAARRELARLSAQELADIGLGDRSRSKADLSQVARALALRH